ncbi:MarR family winged helix-turn-helix transcriptional regulator [Pseudonocardia pini]|uniref:MarR family winged helix-turn-helix transcriptional regulator n=1 Tax=Pseudonocardia pini TaxID=2758030 RepID=UPI0015F08079|nr:MarR family winged helix-turn-helix transcriptional regulator [Pseudonocardia pini]
MPEPLDRLVTSAGAALLRFRRRAAAEHGLSATALDVLTALTVDPHESAVRAATQAPSQRDLAGRLGIAPATLTPVLDELERAGDLRRHRDPVDRRVVRVRATAAGVARCRVAQAAVDRAVRGALPRAGVDDEAVRRYLAALLESVRS